MLPTHKFDIFIQGLVRNSSEDFEFSAILFNGTPNYEPTLNFNGYNQAFSLGCLSPRTLIKNIYICRKIIKRVKPDIVHVTTYFSGIAIMLSLLTIKQKPKFLWNRHYNKGHHNLESKIHIAMDRLLTLRSDTTIVISHAQLETLVYAEKSDISKIQVINNGIDLDLLKISSDGRSYFRKQFRRLDKELVLIAIGRLHPEKDYLTLFDALIFLQQMGFNFHLYIAGTGDPSYIAFLNAKILELDLTSSITFLGWVEEIHSAVLESDLFVQASLDEAFGLSILESAALGISIATTTPGGVAEITSGFHPFVAPGDAATLAKVMSQKIFETAEKRSFISNYVMERFSIVSMASKYNEVYYFLNSRT